MRIALQIIQIKILFDAIKARRDSILLMCGTQLDVCIKNAKYKSGKHIYHPDHTHTYTWDNNNTHTYR